ncbi:hypothetical protein DV096_12040 [Bradymonadaceae bacterium TMQ3]|uniref:Uncharacterized protein n=1 Tax=Lujinxingia sediminis TaxID=2480984 RepID=A0ABY0CRX6_9DELT|nr:hypothetical protein [Lujinxingia sediminis]RDV37838.1 hypothetical protein DV096_12040 [Bradymonadaceae bacterium TMQ3]RVU42829.1 hypothetical protein EA187_15075 [Lujinxingia sediminis]TXC75379.1 hypothetical protein FRC91_11720 [Bradymonadales bacterium TMQ1]
MEIDQREDNKKTLKIVLVVLGVTALLSALCCGGAAFLGVGMFGELAEVEKTYYPACDMLEDSEACSDCCRERGHNGYVYGDWLNEEGRFCGCLGDEKPDGVAPMREEGAAAE